MLNDIRLLKWLYKRANNINAQIFINIIENKDSDINIEKHHQVYPYMLFSEEISNRDVIKELKKILATELNSTNESHLYLRKKLDLTLDDFEVHIDKIHESITLEMLNKDINIEYLYDLLFLVEFKEITESKKYILANVIPSLIVNNCIEYNFIEASILVHIAEHICSYIPNEFWKNTRDFFENHQRFDGSFGYFNPFLNKHFLTENENIIRSYYCYKVIKTIDKIQRK